MSPAGKPAPMQFSLSILACSQSNMYPADAAAAWPAMEAAAARMGRLRIGAPSASGCGGGPL